MPGVAEDRTFVVAAGELYRRQRAAFGEATLQREGDALRGILHTLHEECRSHGATVSILLLLRHFFRAISHTRRIEKM